MSTVREHIEDLRKIATTLEQRGESGHGNRQNSRQFQFAAILLCGVHLDELEAMVIDRRPPADLSDGQIKALVNDSPELAALDYGAAYLLVRKIERAANATEPTPQRWRFDATNGDPETGDQGDLVPVDTSGVAIPFARGSWQHAVDDELVNYGRTSQSFATPHEAVKWLLSIERDVPLACLSVTPECRESGCAAARNAGVVAVVAPRMSDAEIDKVWRDTPAQGDPTGKLFYRYFARAVLAANAGVKAVPPSPSMDPQRLRELAQEKLDQRITALALAHCADEFDDGGYLCYSFQFPGLREFVKECARLAVVDGVSLVDGESSLHQTPIPSPMDSEREG